MVIKRIEFCIEVLKITMDLAVVVAEAARVLLSHAPQFLCRFNLTMAQTNADDDLKSKSLKAEFASVNSVGNKQEEFGRSFCIAVKRLQHIKGLLNVLLQKRYDEATYGGKFIDGTILR
ncbi:unnamed protein product [Brassica oleracea]|uniref:(rape) hypothetical protein n=1 Tax=Brassica napus TaxID=3708 RepID=A0A816IR41_BRANA|nr:unnamed protein product [Brassica napus]